MIDQDMFRDIALIITLLFSFFLRYLSYLFGCYDYFSPFLCMHACFALFKKKSSRTTYRTDLALEKLKKCSRLMRISKENLHGMAMINSWVNNMINKDQKKLLMACSSALRTIFSDSNCQSRKSFNFNFCPQHYHHYQMGFWQFVKYYMYSTKEKHFCWV